MKNIVKFLLMVWQVPQYIIALYCLMVIYLFKQYTTSFIYKDKIVIKFKPNKFIPGGSFGEFIFLDDNFQGEELRITVKHEYGHTVQSLRYGPLYLVIIGILSVVGNIYSRFVKIDYYDQPWEKEADILGGVTKSEREGL